MNLTIRKATLDDVKTISKIYALSWKATYKDSVPQSFLDNLSLNNWVSSFQNWFSNHILTAQLICENGTPIGCAAYGNARDDKFSHWGEIVSIYLHPDYFGKGYGTKLMKAVLSDMKKLGYESCYLWVLKENSNARHFYEANGFVCNNDECTYKIMKKELTDVRYLLSVISKSL